ncbi:sensor histidine kinase [Catalinimonas niigatensis]|uniref:sensor histidine kinase n=1 Tax=Catalinimonas niigatensis TaxID=1397264 RepID=UPI002666A005|nr:histidine kinase [Catalinimonas niigatensis]WPP48644.1 histidine kinase [Catalinimonas niigatensis]
MHRFSFRQIDYFKVAKELVANLALATLIVFSLAPEKFFSEEGLLDIWDQILYSLILCLGLGYGNGYLNDILNKRYSWIHYPVKRLLYSIAMLLYSFVFCLIAVYIFVNIQHSGNAPNITLSEYISYTYIPLGIAVLITAFLTSRGFLMSWRQAAIESEQLKRAHIASQYESLKNQINPHFLFNSLNALTHLVYEDQDQAALFIRKLAEVYRYVLDTQEKEVVSLSEELAFVKSCVFLHKIRFEDNLQVDIQLPEDENLMLPPLSLQMLLENAIKHNEISDEHPLHIQITTQREHIVVTNTIQKKAHKEYSSGLGLQNIKSRYEHLSSLSVEILEDLHGFTVKLPLLKFSHHEGIDY